MSCQNSAEGSRFGSPCRATPLTLAWLSALLFISAVAVKVPAIKHEMMTTNNNRALENERKTVSIFFMIFLWQLRFPRNELMMTEERQSFDHLNSNGQKTLHTCVEFFQTDANRTLII
jgi:hypothetical protein